jgi:hypothetical protein
MSMIYTRRNGSNGGAGPAEDRIACLDVLAAQLHARGWTAYITTPDGRLARLLVQDPDDRAECGDVMAAPDDSSGEWWYWFGWAERIAPVSASASAAETIIRVLRRPAGSAATGS